MSFLKKLFGGGGGAKGPSFDADTYQGFTIQPAPMAEGGQFRLAATVSKEIAGSVKEHRLIRADLFASAEEAASASLRKARQVIDEQGERLFGQVP